MVEINRVWLNVDTDTNKITLFSRPRVSIRVDEYIWSLIEEHIVKPHKFMRSEKHKYLLKIAFGRFDSVRHQYYPLSPYNGQLREGVKPDSANGWYSFSEDGTKIRANQGHSIQVDVELPVTEPPETLYHGTAQRFAASIEVQGLLPQSRLYVHLSPDPETAEKVGQRHGQPVIYLVDAGQMHRDGYLFYLSANGVWLTKVVPAPYLKRLEE